jgi:hypothetical protein
VCNYHGATGDGAGLPDTLVKMSGPIALPNIPGLERLRAMTSGHPDIRIAVLDGPVDPVAIAGRIEPAGAKEHGTLVASIISGARDGGVKGVAPGCTLIPITVFDGETASGCSQDRLAGAIDLALECGANVINISAAQQADALSLSTALAGAIGRAAKADAIIVASTGNHGCACDTIPASAPGVLAVGALDAGGAPLVGSNWGPAHRTQGLLAPGLDVAGACVGGGVCRGTGTSFATAVTSGVAGLLLSLERSLGFQPSGARARRVLLAASDRAIPPEAERLSKYLAGRLDLTTAVDVLLSELATSEQQGAMVETAEQTTVAEAPAGAIGLLEPAGQKIEVMEPLASGAGAITLADCGCGCGGAAKAKTPQLVYAIGRLGVSFTSMARRDAIWRSINARHPAGEGGVTPEIDLRPISNAALRDLLRDEPWQAQAVVWVLSRTEVPMYAIVASGAFAESVYRWMVEQWSDPAVEFISLPGVIAGQMTLYDGMTVDVVVPDMRGMYSWSTRKYVEALVAGMPKPSAAKKAGAAGASDGDRVGRFLSKLYYRIRNRGITAEERALNAAATNAFNLSDVVVSAGSEGLALRDISVEKSPFNRPGGQYYDVLLTFFSPDDRLGKAPLVARFTIDVSDTVPVLVGEPVQWYEY